MILESRFWKDDLLAHAASLRARMAQQRWSDASFARCEQSIMLGFYAIRKLIEARRLSRSTRIAPVPMRSYPARGIPATLANKDRVEQLYDLEHGLACKRPLRFVCNQAIHSFVFLLVTDEQRHLVGVMVNTTNNCSEEVLELSAMTIADVFERVGKDRR
ncbi:MAG: hypothetical protein M3O35_10015 [Acidobacteriota bacterium]|nr:hypothetical protein [Acidobacteriota bacterium]